MYILENNHAFLFFYFFYFLFIKLIAFRMAKFHADVASLSAIGLKNSVNDSHLYIPHLSKIRQAFS